MLLNVEFFCVIFGFLGVRVFDLFGVSVDCGWSRQLSLEGVQIDVDVDLFDLDIGRFVEVFLVFNRRTIVGSFFFSYMMVLLKVFLV